MARLLLLTVLLASACHSDSGAGRATTNVRDAQPSANAAGYVDDTSVIPANAQVVQVRGEQSFRPYFFKKKSKPGRVFLDLREARFTISNSRNQRPTPAQPCNSGSLPTNTTPLTVYSVEDATVVSGLFDGRVPQDADWKATYCDSTALNLKRSRSNVVDGVRISRAWDGIRIGIGSPHFVIKNSWLSDIRDDAIENDPVLDGRIEDTLIDGALMGISHRPTGPIIPPEIENVVEITGLLLRLQEYPYEGQSRLGALIKSEPRSPKLRITNSVIAIESNGGLPIGSSWKLTWDKMSSASNNLILWLSDGEIPAKFNIENQPGFRLIKGPQARAIWLAAVTNWINCHPRVPRVAGDPSSDFRRCKPGTWGGYSH